MLLVRCLMMDPNCLMPCGAVVDGGASATRVSYAMPGGGVLVLWWSTWCWHLEFLMWYMEGGASNASQI